VNDLWRLMTLQDANTRIVLLGTTLLGLAAAVVGSFTVLRQRALVGDAVAHAALPGLCAAYLLIGERDLLAFMIGAMVFGLLAAAFIAAVKRFTRVKEDSAIALAIGGFFGLGIVLSHLIQRQPTGNRAGLDGFIFGKAASMVSQDAQLILIAAAFILLAVTLLYKELKLLCFDRAFAAGQGWPTLTLDLALMGLICLCTVVGLPAVGVVLMVALLVIPPVAARFWTQRLGPMILLAGALGACSGFLGTILSAAIPSPEGSRTQGWPTGPMIVLVAASLFFASMMLAPRRGLVADALRRLSLRRRIADQHLLRDAYEALEPARDLARVWTPQAVARSGSFPRGVLARATRHGLIAPAVGGYVLTAHGQLEATRMVRAHRLWEQYLIQHADIAADHVDRDADEIEHVLPATLITQLETALAERGHWPSHTPAAEDIPASPHPLPLAAPHHAHDSNATNPSNQPRKPITPLVLIAGIVSLLLVSEPTRAALLAPDVPMPDAHAPLASLSFIPLRLDDLWTLTTAIVCAVACGLVGTFLVLRRMALLGDAISHAILPGLALGFILSGTRELWPMLVGAMTVGVLTALLSAGLSRWGKVPEDAAMGIVFTTLFAIGVILITQYAGQVDLDPGCVLYGLLEAAAIDSTSILGVRLPRVLPGLTIILIINLALITIFYKELKIVCFDAALATSMGLSAWIIHYGLMTTVAATAVASFEAVGSILVIAMLVAPGATAQLLTDKLSHMLAWSALIAALAATIGFLLALAFNTNIAGMIATVSLGMFILAAIFAPRHGILARSRQQRVLSAPEPASQPEVTARP
jgi:manganese/zinc/iron transport system permease protein